MTDRGISFVHGMLEELKAQGYYEFCRGELK